MKNAIVYLVRNDKKTIQQFTTSLEYLHKNLDSNCDILTFVEYDFNKDLINELCSKFPRLTFRYIKCPQVNVQIEAASDFGMGYRHMCNWMFDLPFSKYLDSYDMYLRLDTDSYILNKIDYDPFQVIREQKKTVGYIGETYDAEYTTTGILSFFRAYCVNNNIPVSRLDKLITDNKYNLRIIYNNFELVDIKRYRKPEVLKLHEYVWETGNIFKYRWGDAPLRTFVTQLFFEQNDLYRFTDIDYYHGGYCQIGGIIYNNTGWVITENHLTNEQTTCYKPL